MRAFPCLSWFSILRCRTQIQLLANPSEVWIVISDIVHGVIFSGKQDILATYLNFYAETEYGFHNTVDGHYCSHGLC